MPAPGISVINSNCTNCINEKTGKKHFDGMLNDSLKSDPPSDLCPNAQDPIKSFHYFNVHKTFISYI